MSKRSAVRIPVEELIRKLKEIARGMELVGDSRRGCIAAAMEYIVEREDRAKLRKGTLE